MQVLGRWPVLLAVVYFLGGLAAWFHYQLADASGLHDLGLRAYVLPVTMLGNLLGMIVGATDFLLIPQSMGMAGAALFFFPALALLTWLVGWFLPSLFRKLLDE